MPYLIYILWGKIKKQNGQYSLYSALNLIFENIDLYNQLSFEYQFFLNNRTFPLLNRNLPEIEIIFSKLILC